MATLIQQIWIEKEAQGAGRLGLRRRGQKTARGDEEDKPSRPEQPEIPHTSGMTEADASPASAPRHSREAHQKDPGERGAGHGGADSEYYKRNRAQFACRRARCRADPDENRVAGQRGQGRRRGRDQLGRSRETTRPTMPPRRPAEAPRRQPVAAGRAFDTAAFDARRGEIVGRSEASSASTSFACRVPHARETNHAGSGESADQSAPPAAGQPGEDGDVRQRLPETLERRDEPPRGLGRALSNAPTLRTTSTSAQVATPPDRRQQTQIVSRA